MRLTIPLSLLIALLVATSARAAWFPAEPIDGPSADVVKLGGVDLARDGTGALVYIKRDGGVAHVFLSRLFDGTWHTPQRVDNGLAVPATDATVAVADGGTILVAWVAGGDVYGAFGANLQGIGGPTRIGGPGMRYVDSDMAVDDAGYVAFGGNGDVGAARVQNGAWAGVPAPLDISPAADAGTDAGPPRVAVGADGNALVTWAEGPAGATHVVSRRLLGTNLSQYPQDLGAGTHPELDIEDDSSLAWVTFQQDQGGRPGTVARQLRGTLYDPPVPIDGGAGALTPHIDMSGTGEGAAVSSGVDLSVLWTFLTRDAFQAPLRIDSGGSTADPAPLPAASERADEAVVWRVQDATGAGSLHARYKPRGLPFEGEATVSRPDLGPVAPGDYAVAADRAGDVAAALVQGTEGARTLAAGVYDKPPGMPSTRARNDFQRPLFVWAPGVDLWGPQTFQVLVDGALVGQTAGTSLVPARPIRAGRHRWRVVAVDRRGQQTPSRERVVRIDSLAPRIRVTVSGTRRAGLALRIAVRARDVGGSGLDRIVVAFGDGSSTTRSRSVHRYRAGRFTLTVRAFDKAGNVGRKAVRLRIRG